MPNPGPASTQTANYFGQANSPDGWQIGSLSTTPVGTHGVTPVAQRSNATQLNVTSGAPGGAMLSVRSVALEPAAIAASTTLSMAFTATGSPITPNDVVIVNAITGWAAGTGVANVRPVTVTAGAVVMQLFNLTAADVTPIAVSQFLFAVPRGLSGTIALTPSAVAANATSEQTFNVTGVAPGEFLYVAKASEQQGIGIAGCRVAANNQIAITFLNQSTAAITPSAAETYTYFASNGLQAASNLMVYGANVGTIGVINTSTTNSWGVVEQTFTQSSIRVNDFLVGVSKPTTQGNIGIVGQRVSAVNQLAVTFASGSVTGVTPTANQVYQCLVYRQNPTAPFLLTTATCAPTAIAGGTTVEQAFTITPLPADAIVWANKPTATSGLGIVGFRVSAAGVVAITFANALVSTTITPDPEVYTFGFISPSPSGGSNINMQVARGAQGALDKSNELGTALTAFGPITGGTP